MGKNRKQGNWALAIGLIFAVVGFVKKAHWGWYVSLAGLIGYGIYYSFLS